MNKLLAFLPVLVVLLCGCTADDDTATDGAVRFDVGTDTKTRGSVIGGTTLPVTESFRVYAWTTVGGETSVMMTRDATDAESNVVSNTSGYWAPKRRYYWPDDASATVSFYAVYPKDFTVVKNGADVTADITVPTAVAEQHDVMAARTVDLSLAATTGGAAPLMFRHLTSQVSFRAQLAPAFAGWQVSVRSIRLCNVNSRGTYNYATHSITPASPAVPQDYDLVMAAASVTVSSISEPVALTSASDVAMLLPQTLTAWDRTNETAGSAQPLTNGSYIAVGCTITDSNGRQAFSGLTYVPLPAEWLSARHYNYLLEFGSGYTGQGDPSVANVALSCAITDWQEGTGGNNGFEI